MVARYSSRASPWVTPVLAYHLFFRMHSRNTRKGGANCQRSQNPIASLDANATRRVGRNRWATTVIDSDDEEIPIVPYVKMED
jgi:hypothetical protein